MKYFSLAAIALLLGGCFFSSNYRQIEEFDLSPVPVKFSRPVGFGSFTNLSGSDRRFLVRQGTQTTRAEYSRWVSNPDLMLMRALSAGVPDAATDQALPRCGLTLYRFGWGDGSAQLAAAVTLTQGKTTCRWMFQTQEKCAGKSAAEHVGAMDQCVQRLAASIQEKLAKLPEQK